VNRIQIAHESFITGASCLKGEGNYFESCGDGGLISNRPKRATCVFKSRINRRFCRLTDGGEPLRQETGQQLPVAIPHTSASRPRPVGPLSTKLKRKLKKNWASSFLWSPGGERFIQRPSAEKKMWRDGGSGTIQGEMGRKAVGDASRWSTWQRQG